MLFHGNQVKLPSVSLSFWKRTSACAPAATLQRSGNIALCNQESMSGREDSSHAKKVAHSLTTYMRETSARTTDNTSDAEDASHTRKAMRVARNVSDSDEASQAKKTHLSLDDYRVIVSWMEILENFNAVHGTGAKITKKSAFGQLAAHLNRRTKTPNLQRLSADNMQQRWNTFKQRFKKTLKMSTSETGMGLSKKEVTKGLSVPGKLEQLCPQFNRMRELFGEKANVRAACTIELGIATENCISVSCSERSDSESDDDITDFSFDACTSSRWSERASPRQSASTSPRRPAIASPRRPPSIDSSSLPLGSVELDLNAATLVAEIESAVKAPAKRPQVSTADNNSTTAVIATKRPGRAELATVTKKAKIDHPNAQDSRISLSHSYALNNHAKIDFYKRKLEQEARQWKGDRDENERKRAFEREGRQAKQKQDMMMALINLGKSAEEIREYLELVGETI